MSNFYISGRDSPKGSNVPRPRDLRANDDLPLLPRGYERSRFVSDQSTRARPTCRARQDVNASYDSALILKMLASAGLSVLPLPNFTLYLLIQWRPQQFLFLQLTMEQK